MNVNTRKAVKVAKYQLYNFQNAVAIYYLVIILIGLLFFIASTNESSQTSSFSTGSVIFIFILGLVTFRESFLFMQVNNVSRRIFFLGNLIAGLILAVIMAVIDFFIDNVFDKLITYQGLFEQLYYRTGFIAQFVWSSMVLFFFLSLGWLTTMIYYRCNTLQKTLVSLSPVVAVIGLSYVNYVTDGQFGSAVISFFGKALGMAEVISERNPYIAAASFCIGAVAILLGGFLLIYRAPSNR